METALVLGKFLPFHKGHDALIRWTRSWADRVVVLVGALANEPIPGPVRWEWVSRHYFEDPSIRVEYTDAELPTAPKPDPTVSRVWGDYLKKRFPEVTCISASEHYAPMVAEAMGIGYRLYDPDRKNVAISATQIRQDPWKYWDFLPDIVRPWFIKKVCLVGAESTGKTTLAQLLAEHFQTEWVEEKARALIDAAGAFHPGLLSRITWVQEEAVRQAGIKARRWLFVDSDFITTRFYARKLAGSEWIPPWTPLLQRTHAYDLYLFCEPDIPYALDPQRSPTDERALDSSIFWEEYQKTGIPMVRVRGVNELRLQNALKALGEWERGQGSRVH